MMKSIKAELAAIKKQATGLQDRSLHIILIVSAVFRKSHTIKKQDYETMRRLVSEMRGKLDELVKHIDKSEAQHNER